jgi:hypothetical protein
MRFVPQHFIFGVLLFVLDPLLDPKVTDSRIFRGARGHESRSSSALHGCTGWRVLDPILDPKVAITLTCPGFLGEANTPGWTSSASITQFPIKTAAVLTVRQRNCIFLSGVFSS